MENDRLSKKTKLTSSGNVDSKDELEQLLNRILDEKQPFRELADKANRMDYETLSPDFARSFIEKCSKVSDYSYRFVTVSCAPVLPTYHI